MGVNLWNSRRWTGVSWVLAEFAKQCLQGTVFSPEEKKPFCISPLQNRHFLKTWCASKDPECTKCRQPRVAVLPQQSAFMECLLYARAVLSGSHVLSFYPHNRRTRSLLLSPFYIERNSVTCPHCTGTKSPSWATVPSCVSPEPALLPIFHGWSRGGRLHLRWPACVAGGGSQMLVFYAL